MLKSLDVLCRCTNGSRNTDPKAHAQEFLAHCLVPESIDQRVADGAGKGQPSSPGLQGWGDTVLPPEGLRVMTTM